MKFMVNFTNKGEKSIRAKMKVASRHCRSRCLSVCNSLQFVQGVVVRAVPSSHTEIPYIYKTAHPKRLSCESNVQCLYGERYQEIILCVGWGCSRVSDSHTHRTLPYFWQIIPYMDAITMDEKSSKAFDWKIYSKFSHQISFQSAQAPDGIR